MVELMLVFTFIVVFLYIYNFMKKIYGRTYSIIHCITLGLLVTALVNLAFYYATSHILIGYLFLGFVFLVIGEFAYLNRHPLAGDQKHDSIFVTVFDAIVLGFVVNCIYLLVISLFPYAYFLLQILFAFGLAAIYVLIQWQYGRMIKEVRIIRRMTLPLLAVIAIAIFAVSYTGSDSGTISAETDAVLYRPLTVDTEYNSHLMYVTDAVMKDNYIYYVVEEDRYRLYAYDIVGDTLSTLLYSVDNPRYLIDFICINQFQDELYVTTQSGLYYLEAGELTVMSLVPDNETDIQFTDFYSALYSGPCSTTDDTETLFYETEESLFLVQGDYLAPYPESFDLDWTVVDIPDGYDLISKFAWKLEMYNIFSDGETYQVNSSSTGTEAVLTYIQEHILNKGDFVHAELPEMFTASLGNHDYVFVDNVRYGRYELISEPLGYLDTEPNYSTMLQDGDKLYYVTWDIYSSYVSYNNNRYNYYLDVVLIGQSSLTFNTSPSDNLKPTYFLIYLALLVPLYFKKDRLYDL